MIGVITLSLSVMLIGKSRARELVLCEKYESSFLRLLIFAEQKISSRNMKLCDIYSIFSDEALEKCGFLALLREQRGEDALSSALVKYDKGTLVGERFCELLFEFSSSIGKCRSRESSCELCKKYISYLKNEQENETVGRKEKAAMASRLSVIAGVFVAVVLL